MRVRRECSPDNPRAKSPLSRRGREEASLAAGARVRLRQAAAGGPGVAPPDARAFPPEFPSGSNDSRGKLNILGQGEASCQVPTLHGVLPPPPPSPLPPPPPTPPPHRPRRHQPPKYQLNRRDRGAAAVAAAAAAAARGRVLCSPRSGPSRQAEKVAFPRETLLGSLGSWGRARGTGSSLPLAPVGRGGGGGLGQETKRGEAGEGVGEDVSSPGGAAAAVTSPLLPPPRRVAESPNQNKRRRLALRAGPLRPRRRLTRRRKTRDGASALRSLAAAAAAAAAGRLPPGSLHSRPSPPRARPSPPRGRAAAGPAPGLCAALGQRPYAAARPGAEPSSSRATQGAPGPQESPPRARAGVFGWLPESTRGVWENAGGGGGANSGRRRSEGGGRRGGTAASEPSVGGPGEEGARELGWILPNR